MESRSHRARVIRAPGSGNETGVGSHAPPRIKPAALIGVALEFSAGKEREQRCYGTYEEDMPDRAFRFNILFVKHNGEFKMHAHEYSELVIVLGGRGLHLTDRKNYPIEEGDVFVVPRNARHGFSDARGLQLCNIQFDPRQFLRGQRTLERMAGYHALFHPDSGSQTPDRLRERLHLSTAEMVYVTSLLAALKTEFERREEGWQIFIRSTFLLLVCYFSRVYALHKKDQATPLMRMANVISHIQQHFREPLRIGTLAKIAHLSASQFQRSFKRTYNTTPQKFVRQVRLHEACEMLKDSNRDITNIALDTGFSSSSFFATQFRQQFGESPSQYRRRKIAELDKHCLRTWSPLISETRVNPSVTLALCPV